MSIPKPERPCVENDIVFAYQSDVDGIHLQCVNCGWDQAIGFLSEYGQAVAAAATHVPMEAQ